ncbi:hypothetical protein QBC44DRAFT_280780 [Cladorrhinum sp. PSN332]|nr:hypothetical protein QBC44DRAFT_280780 [Cladorrhinum sp. PSN332]
MAVLPTLTLTHAQPAISLETAANPTLPSTTLVGWVPPDGRRSTWDIIFSCLSIFVLCSWRCVHLNVPAPKEMEEHWWSWSESTVPVWGGSISYPILRSTWSRKLKWMAIICLAPEVGVALAVSQWQKAQKALHQSVKTSGPKFNDLSFSRSHAFFAEMGGILIRSYEIPAKNDSETVKPPRNRSEKEIEPVPSGDPVATTANRSLGNWKIKNEHMATLAELNAEMQDKSDSDVITKTFAVVQSAWLVIQSVARISTGLSISELELATLGFIFCAIVMYGFWWDKPFNVQCRYVVSRLEDGYKFERSDERHVDQRYDNWNDAAEEFIVPDLDKIDFGDKDTIIGSTAFYTTGGIFAGIHMCAWNWTFPSELIQALWRGFSVATLVLTFLFPLVLFPLEALTRRLQDHPNMPKGLDDRIVTSMIYLLIGLYILSRLGILVLTFYCFSSMPETVYTRLDWTGFIPHFA